VRETGEAFGSVIMCLTVPGRKEEKKWSKLLKASPGAGAVVSASSSIDNVSAGHGKYNVLEASKKIFAFSDASSMPRMIMNCGMSLVL